MRQKVHIRVRFTGLAKFEKIAANVQALAMDPSALANIIKLAVQETLLLMYMKRFTDKQDVIADMRRMDNWTSGLYRHTMTMRAMAVDKRLEDEQKKPKHLQVGIEALKEKSRLAHLRLGDQGHQDSDEDPSTDQVVADGEHQGLRTFKPRGGAGSLGAGEGFHALMMKVMKAIVDPTQMVSIRTANRMVIGIGDRAVLDAIHTPSHNAKKYAGKYKILWRHMEFGTGAYAKPTFRTNGRTKESGGTWWYGRQVGDGIHLRGSRPGNILRKESGEVYNADFMKFEATMHLALDRALCGRGA